MPSKPWWMRRAALLDFSPVVIELPEKWERDLGGAVLFAGEGIREVLEERFGKKKSMWPRLKMISFEVKKRRLTYEPFFSETDDDIGDGDDL